MASWSRWLLGLSCLVALGSTIRVYLVSPDLVPVHYGIRGIPDRWGSPLEVFVAHACIIGIGTALFLALPTLIRRAPDTLLNLPNKEYWLSPERRATTLAKFARCSDLIGAATNALMLTLQLLLPPNGEVAADGSNHSAVVLAAFLAFTLGACLWLALAFRMPARSE